ncbi:uncharacterized protein LOC135471518 [Liolophura sinensis]|uniref:uncharacterized protein LOC135471518 n=1 Tax=Liolophura sinensis TaxID=3198878 RepID=UPI003157F24A
MRVAIAAVLAALLTLTSAQTRSATVQCYEFKEKYQMIFTVEKNDDTDVNFVYAVNSTNSKVETCASSLTPELFTITNTSFSIAINITKNIVIVDANCDHTKDGLEYQWQFLTTKFKDVIVKSLDVLYVVACNFSNATPTFISSHNNVTGDTAENAPQINQYTFGIEVLDSSNAVVTTIALGQDVKLRIKQLTGDPVAVTGHTCFASPDGIFDGTGDYELILPNGCPSVLGGIQFMTAGFTGSIGSAISGTLEQFQFTGYPSVHYQCLVRYCLDGDNQCTDYCASQTGRRKREVEEEETMAQTSISITMYPDPVTEEQKSECEIPSNVKNSCLNDVGVIVAFSVLGALLLVTMVVAVSVVVRASRQLQASRAKSEL